MVLHGPACVLLQVAAQCTVIVIDCKTGGGASVRTYLLRMTSPGCDTLLL